MMGGDGGVGGPSVLLVLAVMAAGIGMAWLLTEKFEPLEDKIAPLLMIILPPLLTGVFYGNYAVECSSIHKGNWTPVRAYYDIFYANIAVLVLVVAAIATDSIALFVLSIIPALYWLVQLVLVQLLADC